MCIKRLAIIVLMYKLNMIGACALIACMLQILRGCCSSISVTTCKIFDSTGVGKVDLTEIIVFLSEEDMVPKSQVLGYCHVRFCSMNMRLFFVMFSKIIRVAYPCA